MDHEDERLKEALEALDLVRVPMRSRVFERRLEASIVSDRSIPSLPSRRPAHLWRRKRILVAAAAVVLVAAAVTAVTTLLPAQSGSPTSPALGPADASAAQVAAWMTKGLAAASSIEGQVLIRSEGPYSRVKRAQRVERIDFLGTSEGDFRSDVTILKDTSSPHHLRRLLTTYDARSHVFEAIAWQAFDRIGTVRVTHADPDTSIAPMYTMPYSGMSSYRFTQLSYFATVVRSELLTGWPRIKPHSIVYRGRPAWKIVFKSIWTSATETAIVDRATGILLYWRTAGRALFGPFEGETIVTRLQVDPTVDRSAFTPALPPVNRGRGRHAAGHVELVKGDAGVRFTQLAGVLSATSKAPLVPEALPNGFRLLGVACFAVRGYPQLLPASAHALVMRWRVTARPDSVVTTYERGLQRVLVSLWPRRLVHGLVATNAHLRSTTRFVKLSSGALAGQTAELSLNPESLSLSVEGRGYTVWISGDLTPPELIAAANSLQVVAP